MVEFANTKSKNNNENQLYISRDLLHCKCKEMASRLMRVGMSQSRRRQWHPAPVLLPGKPHGWRSLIGCSPRGRYESHTTEQLHFHALEKEMATHSCVLAWRIPGTGEPGGLLSMGSERTGLRRLSSSSSMSQIHRAGCWEGTGLEAHGQNFFGESNTLFLSLFFGGGCGGVEVGKSTVPFSRGSS